MKNIHNKISYEHYKQNLAVPKPWHRHGQPNDEMGNSPPTLPVQRVSRPRLAKRSVDVMRTAEQRRDILHHEHCGRPFAGLIRMFNSAMYADVVSVLYSRTCLRCVLIIDDVLKCWFLQFDCYSNSFLGFSYLKK